MGGESRCQERMNRFPGRAIYGGRVSERKERGGEADNGERRGWTGANDSLKARWRKTNGAGGGEEDEEYSHNRWWMEGWEGWVNETNERRNLILMHVCVHAHLCAWETLWQTAMSMRGCAWQAGVAVYLFTPDCLKGLTFNLRRPSINPKCHYWHTASRMGCIHHRRDWQY